MLRRAPVQGVPADPQRQSLPYAKIRMWLRATSSRRGWTVASAPDDVVATGPRAQPRSASSTAPASSIDCSRHPGAYGDCCSW